MTILLKGWPRDLNSESECFQKLWTCLESHRQDGGGTYCRLEWRSMHGTEEPGSKDGSEKTWACEGLVIPLFPCKAGLLTEALVGPQIQARNPRMAIRRLGGLVTISRGYLGRIQAPGLSCTRKRDLGSSSWKNLQDDTEKPRSCITRLGRAWPRSGFSRWTRQQDARERRS